MAYGRHGKHPKPLQSQLASRLIIIFIGGYLNARSVSWDGVETSRVTAQASVFNTVGGRTRLQSYQLAKKLKTEPSVSTASL
ncbi:hypothetical protein EYF80_040083 [Liparis tanakae]|uniref:Uncharacterized protein n=1 Tax=Liparis tanakae TaxID=230148 RepID=A0A4Z2GAA7_9TELE|nr:hypothetical protein EYF80_040083 [Liparis tanakae]